MEPYWQCGDLKLMEQSRRAFRSGREIGRLQPQQLRVLLYLFEHQDEVAKKEDLQQLLWGKHESSDEHRLQTLVSELRKIVGQGPIRTVPGTGYQLVGLAQRVDDKADVQSQRGYSGGHTGDANVFIHANGRFEKKGQIWEEYGDDVRGGPIHRFKELWRNEEYIYMYDEARRRDSGRPMHLRIPVRGGAVQWTYPNPMQWIDLMVVGPYFAEAA